jgi:hypothetical protein
MSRITASHSGLGPAPGRTRRRSEILSLLAALLVLLGLAVNTVSCGSDDLIFPGEIPFTSTPAQTDTPDPDDEEVQVRFTPRAIG